MQLVLTPELILEAYRHGLFPMAYSSDSPYIHWVCPEMRGQLSITDIHIPKRLKSTIQSAPYEIRVNTAFEDVMRLCAEPHETRPETWINESILANYSQLHEQGYAHSIEAWAIDGQNGNSDNNSDKTSPQSDAQTTSSSTPIDTSTPVSTSSQSNRLVGGVYGLSIGGAFFGESMFSRARDASKICLIHLCARLWKGGFSMLDTQFVNDHLLQFGCYEILHEEYKTNLNQSLEQKTDFLLADIDERDLIENYLDMREKA